MASKTDWRGAWFSVFAGAIKAGTVLIWSAASSGLLIGVTGVGGVVGAAANILLRRKFWIPLSVVTFLATFAVAYHFRDRILPPPSGPRFELQGIKAERGPGYYQLFLEIGNTSDTEASSFFVSASMFTSPQPNEISNSDVTAKFASAYDAATKWDLAPGTVKIAKGMGIEIKLNNTISQQDIYAAEAGSVNLYLIIFAKYSNEPSPIKHVWVTEVCSLMTRPFTGFQSCPRFNDYFYADQKLNRLD